MVSQRLAAPCLPCHSDTNPKWRFRRATACRRIPLRVSSVSSGLCRPQNEDLPVSNESHPNSRRNFLKSGLIAISTAALPAATVAAAAAPTSSPNLQPTRFLNEPERHFLESAVDRLIPPDGKWPGATEAGVVNYIDLQMGGAWG